PRGGCRNECAAGAKPGTPPPARCRPSAKATSRRPARKSSPPSPDAAAMGKIRPCRDDERPAILAIVNAAAEAYRGAIPADCFHDPYMDAGELDAEIAAGVAFWGYEEDGALVGVMGIQAVGDVDLIRHAYVVP